MENINIYDTDIPAHKKNSRKKRRCRRCSHKHKCKKLQQQSNHHHQPTHYYYPTKPSCKCSPSQKEEKSKMCEEVFGPFGKYGIFGPFGPFACCWQYNGVNPCNPSGGTTQLRGIQLQLQNPATNTIAPGAAVLFDTTITEQTVSITYNSNSGTVTIHESGIYYIDWWVAADGIQGGTDLFPTFAIITSAANNVRASGPNVTGQIKGNALIRVTVRPGVPVTLQLVNGTNATIAFCTYTPIKANIAIFKVM